MNIPDPEIYLGYLLKIFYLLFSLIGKMNYIFFS
jgi:hypothetical protein